MATFVNSSRFGGLLYLVRLYLVLLQVSFSLQYPHEEMESGVIITDFDVSMNLRASRDAVTANPWCYEDTSCSEPTWPQVCLTGTAQSPIDLPKLDKTSCTIKGFPASAYGSHKFSMESNGKTVVVKILDKLPSFDWQEQNGSYIFNSMHMHWGAKDSIGSEHTIASKPFAVEMHLVHVRANFKNLPDALSSGEKNALAVIGLRFEVDPKLKKNADLQPIIKNIPAVINPGVVKTPKEKLNLKPFMKGGQAYHYMGSLTTPGCDEAVAWLVWKKAAKISPSDLEALRKVKKEGGGNILNNFRSIQKTNDRKVKLCKI